MIDRRLLYFAISVGCLGGAAVTLVYANAWWVSGLVTLSIGCWLSGVLWTVYAPREQRVAPLGALVCSFLYLLLAVGPWCEQHVGTWLITTRALVAIDTQLLGHQPPPQVAPQTNWVYASGLMNSTVVPWTMPPQPPVEATSPTVTVGQWLCAWCAAAVGAFAALWIARRARTESAIPPTVAGSPFAEAAR